MPESIQSGYNVNLPFDSLPSVLAMVSHVMTRVSASSSVARFNACSTMVTMQFNSYSRHAGGLQGSEAAQAIH